MAKFCRIRSENKFKSESQSRDKFNHPYLNSTVPVVASSRSGKRQRTLSHSLSLATSFLAAAPCFSHLPLVNQLRKFDSDEISKFFEKFTEFSNCSDPNSSLQNGRHRRDHSVSIYSSKYYFKIANFGRFFRFRGEPI
jgi:hypothetical protein